MLNFDCGIYTITSPSDKQYVGSAKSFTKRWRQHRHELKMGKHHCLALQRACDKYGLDALRFGKIAFVAPVDLIWREQEQLDARHSNRLYNRNQLAGSRLGMRHTPESKQKMSAALKGRAGRPLTENDLERLKQARIARGAYTLSDEHKANIAAAGRRRALANNPSGFVGVSRNRDAWVAQVRENGKPKHVGRFATPEEAHAARVAYLKLKAEK